MKLGLMKLCATLNGEEDVFVWQMRIPFQAEVRISREILLQLPEILVKWYQFPSAEGFFPEESPVGDSSRNASRERLSSSR